MRWTSAHSISQDNFTSDTEKIRSGFVNDNACRVLGLIDWRKISITLIYEVICLVKQKICTRHR